MKAHIRQVVDAMEEHGVLTYASAIAFQVLTALIPLALLVLSVMGVFHLESVWTGDLGPQFKAQVSKEVWAVANDYATSFALGAGVTLLVLLASATARFGREVLGLGDPGFAVDALVREQWRA